MQDLLCVEVKIKDSFRFGQVSVVLDNPKVYKRIYQLRKRWKINEFYQYNNYILWIQKLGSSGRDKQFREDVNKLCKFFKLDYSYEKVLKRAIACNEVHDSDFKTAYWEPVFDPHDPSGQTKRFAIYLTPDTKKQEVLNIYDEFIEEVSYSRHPIKHHNYKFIPHITPKKLKDTKNEIRLHREWYWKNQNNKSPKQIAKEITKPKNIDINSYTARIKEAIKAYKVMLSGSFRKS